MKRLSRSFLILAALAAGCARTERSGNPPAVLYRHLVGDPSTLDPTTTTEEEALRVDDLLFRPLVGLDRELRAAPSLARSWTVSPDGLLYEFHLDPKATWEDGSSVTSDDVRFTLERVRDPKVNAATWSWGFENLASIETPDPLTVRVRFSQPYAERLLAFDLPIVSAAAYGRAKSTADTDRHPVGSGPYRLAAWEPNQKIRLVQREGAAPAEAAFSEIVFRVLPEDNTRYLAGLRGELDEFRLSRDQMKTAAASPEFAARNRTFRAPQPIEVLITWNCRNALLADPRVRRALALAWPRQDTAKSLYPPDGAALVSGPYLPRIAANAPDVPPPAYDPAASARLLEEAGWKAAAGGARRKGGKAASLELILRAGARIDTNLSEILRSAYEGVGVELVLRPLDSAARQKRVDAGEFDAELEARFFLPPNADPYPYYHSSQWAPKGLNIGFYKNAEVDRLTEAARREIDPEKRLELYRQVHRAMAADPPADFLWGVDQGWAIAKRIEGVETSPMGLFHFLPGPLGWRPAPASSPPR